MAQLTHALSARLEELLKEPPQCVARPSGIFVDSAGVSVGRGWCVSAASLIAAVVADPAHPYRIVAASHIASLSKNLISACSGLFGQLQHLRRDFDAGILTNLEAQVSAQTFDDILDHAEAYLKEGRHEPAGVLAGVIFEDTVRKLCYKRGIPQEGAALDTLLSELARTSAITSLERKEGTTAAAVRTSATHARWAQFTGEQVEGVLRFTRRLIRDKLAV